MADDMIYDAYRPFIAWWQAAVFLLTIVLLRVLCSRSLFLLFIFTFQDRRSCSSPLTHGAAPALHMYFYHQAKRDQIAYEKRKNPEKEN